MKTYIRSALLGCVIYVSLIVGSEAYRYTVFCNESCESTEYALLEEHFVRVNGPMDQFRVQSRIDR